MSDFDRYRERNVRRADERIAAAVDWDTCCIPGCGTDIRNRARLENPDRYASEPDPDVSERLPVCHRHQVIIRKQAQANWVDDPDMVAARERWAEEAVRKDDARKRRDTLDRENGGTEGQMYFVRLNGLVKVGWSSKLRTRLKQYGADVEILCHFPATREDETLLHRQLRPYLAKGREWYQDCQLIHDVVDGYIEQYGRPTISPNWTVPKPPTIRVRKAG